MNYNIGSKIFLNFAIKLFTGQAVILFSSKCNRNTKNKFVQLFVFFVALHFYIQSKKEKFQYSNTLYHREYSSIFEPIVF